MKNVLKFENNKLRKKQRFLGSLTGFKFDMFNYTHKYPSRQET